MASIDALSFDQPAYSPGQEISLTVNYTPDAPSVTPQNLTATVTLSDSTGAVLATSAAPFVVNQTGPGDTLAVADDGNHAWAKASDSGTVAVFQAVA